ncbi:MAG: hypothetical protein WD851_03070 [Pirellulales bacterium]
MRLIDALTQHPAIFIFAVVDSDPDDQTEWDVEPVEGHVLCESDLDSYFVVKAKNVLHGGTVRDCYIDMCLPERISDLAIFVSGNQLDVRYHHEFDGEIICAVPIDCFGVYELFYSRISPDVGIELLRRGLAAAPRNCHIAEDLGYILRDEHRFGEAAEMFQVAVDGGASSYFIFGELADCYLKIGKSDEAQKYQEMFDHPAIQLKRGVLRCVVDWLRGRGKA